MKIDGFGARQPENFEDIMEVINALDLNPKLCSATLSYQEPGDGDLTDRFDGTSAEVRGSDSDGNPQEFTTCGYADDKELIKDLEAAGITDIDHDGED